MGIYENAVDRFGTSAWQVRLLENGYIPAYGPVNGSMAYEVGNKTKFLESEFPAQSITVEVSGPGGSVPDGMCIIDALRCCRSEVRTIVAGTAASMSAVIAITAAKPGLRFIYPNAQLMLHEVSTEAAGRASDVERSAEHMLATRDTVERMIADASGLPIDRVKELCRQGDRYITAREAVELGLVDEIIPWSD